jgi:hypothetical protein
MDDSERKGNASEEERAATASGECRLGCREVLFFSPFSRLCCAKYYSKRQATTKGRRDGNDGIGSGRQ